MLHRGRIQAQGKNIDQSEAWSQENPPTEKEGVEMIERLKAKIHKQEVKLREQAFEKAEKFIKRASESNGIDAPANITESSLKRSHKHLVICNLLFIRQLR